jgi:hypothetical protein
VGSKPAVLPGRGWTLAVVTCLGIVGLYGLAVTDIPRPDWSDGTIYLGAARGLASEARYADLGYAGECHVTAYPPVTSLLLVPATFFGRDVLASRLIVLACVFAACIVLWRYYRDEVGQSEALAFPLLVALLPEAFIWGTSIASEWPYLALSFQFLLWARAALTKGREGNPVGWSGVAVGAALLAASVLCRWVGACLVVACGVQVLADSVRARSPLLLLRHVLTRATLLAGVPVALWLLRTWFLTHSEASATSMYAMVGVRGLVEQNRSSLLVVLGCAADLFFSFRRVAHFAPILLWPLIALVAACALVGLRGAWLRVRRRELLEDTYVAATLVLLLSVSWKETRYLLPIAPILLHHFVTGLRETLPHWLRRRRLGRLLLLAWLAGSLVPVGMILVRGDGVTYGGTLRGLHPTPTSLYRGSWQDVAVVGELLRREVADGDAFTAFAARVKAIAALARRRVTTIDGACTGDPHATCWLVWDEEDNGPLPPSMERRYPEEVLRQGPYVVRRWRP